MNSQVGKNDKKPKLLFATAVVVSGLIISIVMVGILHFKRKAWPSFLKPETNMTFPNITLSNMTFSNITFSPGTLTIHENGLLLSQGLQSRMIAQWGQKVQLSTGQLSTEAFHNNPDFSATYQDTRASNPGGWIYVSNSENRTIGGGGVGAITFNSLGEVIDYKMLLTGSTSNCGGGRAPWGAWISCEETNDGQVWQVDPTGQHNPGLTSIGKNGGYFESFAYFNENTNNSHFFLTEDRPDGAIHRWRPENPDWSNPWTILYGNGTMDYLILYPLNQTYSWTTNKTEAKLNAQINFPNCEGIDRVGETLYFISKVIKSMFVLNLDDSTYVNVSTHNGDFDGQPDQVQTISGNINSDLFFTEDGGYQPGIYMRNQSGQMYTILESTLYSTDESTGLAFSPNGKHLYFALQDIGIVYDISRSDGYSFHGATLNIKFQNIN